MIPFLAAGIVLGFSAGVAPGPLLALIMAETLQHGLNAGIKAALAPIITDLPIVLTAVLVLTRLAHFHAALGVISICGGFFLFRLGFKNIRIAGGNIPMEGIKENSLKKGIFANLLSPHPYLFWLSVGAPTTVRAMEHSVFAAAAFIGGFYVFLLGSEMIIAAIVGRSRSFLTGRAYIHTMRGLGVMLLIFGGLLFYDGFKLIRLF